MSIRLRPHCPADDAAWDAFVAAHPKGTLYHARGFHDAVQEAFGAPSHGLIAENECGDIVGLMPLIRQRSRLFGDRLVSLPYANHGGPLAEDPSVALELFNAAGALQQELGCQQVEVRDLESRELHWHVHTDKVLMTLALPETPELLGNALGAKMRSQCRRALKEGAEVVHGGVELVPEFYRVFATNMRDLGTPVYPRRWFNVLASHLGDAIHLVVVRLRGEPVAGAVLVQWKNTLEIPWASSHRDFNRFAVNMLLYRSALDFAIRTGCRDFDFGRSTRGSGPHKFKRQWGAEESAIYWRMHPRSAGAGRTSDLVRAIWKRLPLPLANSIGPLLSPSLPW
ncbi:FemAB family XrtA/PEP-CTERM system-associated protein [Wenzhouxiangella sp. XN24]|uniref:FemAB family XrtA/PEP-CTERM system-associated protein n=1 Tax=Wenzhouxiangella sp. XN24 TaxID=2713569 RepID=UPI0013EC451E|nr:FemAB family XrtA/PEP-CTERM system-associated protein [Wenzhouxiangella sp. XN24]NGX17081.1 FemAB family PEP-CTERM system-associated protein [Wenzhouxiangella sp. XN24]